MQTADLYSSCEGKALGVLGKRVEVEVLRKLLLLELYIGMVVEIGMELWMEMEDAVVVATAAAPGKKRDACVCGKGGETGERNFEVEKGVC